MAEPRETAKKLAEELAGRMGDRLRSVLLYGSVARGEAVPKVSDINVLVLLDRVDAGALETLSPLARRWATAGNTAPLLFGWDEWRRAADVFAIELTDMRDAHEVLHGSDPLDGLTFASTALRLQAERELRGKLLQLREGFLVAAGDPQQLGRLLLLALPSFTTYLRAALRLAGRQVPARTPEVIEAGAALVGAEPGPLLEAWNARTADRPPRVSVGDALTAGYYAAAEATAAFIDSLPETPPS